MTTIAKLPTRQRRWTPAAIRAATPHPKPRGAIVKEADFRCGGPVLRDLDSKERRLLRAIIDRADLLDVTTPGGISHEVGAVSLHQPDPGGAFVRTALKTETVHWLLIPVERWMLELMATFEADREDLEDGADREDDGISGEASLGSGPDMDQSRWAAGSYGSEPDLEEGEPDEEDGTREWDEVKPDSWDRSGLDDDIIVDALAALRRRRDARRHLPEPTPSEALGAFVRL
ncbi:MAG: hypothetical protein KIS73_05175 [Enhydrobacter sp.]|nr:hypothetical protein [Enhydrobacter sp.]